MDWDSALLVGQGESLDDILHAAELANVQLAELKAYDQVLDMALEQSYRDLPVWKTHTNKVGTRQYPRDPCRYGPADR